MQGVIQFGTARRINSYNIPVDKAGKTGTTNDYTDGWFIGFTPEILAGTWVGCEDPFLPIYQNNSGGAEMSAPRWGIFMSKVYEDKKLDYGKIKTFDKPAELANDAITVDENWDKMLTSADSLDKLNNGNSAADEYAPEPQKVPVDTGKSKQNTPAIKPGDDKKNPPKPKAKSEYD
jgi:penicillin-binding protein 1A